MIYYSLKYVRNYKIIQCSILKVYSTLQCVQCSLRIRIMYVIHCRYNITAQFEQVNVFTLSSC